MNCLEKRKITIFACLEDCYEYEFWFRCRQVIWLSNVDRAKGYAVDFLSVSLHAVSRDPEAYQSPCIYTQVEKFSSNCFQVFAGLWIDGV